VAFLRANRLLEIVTIRKDVRRYCLPILAVIVPSRLLGFPLFSSCRVTSEIKSYPRGRVIARIFLATHPSVYTASTISNHRLVNLADGKVTFRGKDYAHGRKTTT
jgi:hypothetical protein